MTISVWFHFTLFVAALYISYQGKTLYFELCRKKELINQMQMRNVQHCNVKRLYALPFEANWIRERKILIHKFYLSLPKKESYSSNPPTLSASSDAHENNILISFVFLVSYHILQITSCITHCNVCHWMRSNTYSIIHCEYQLRWAKKWSVNFCIKRLAFRSASSIIFK